MRLGSLLDADELKLRLRCGRAELDREVRWIYTTDLLDPSRYLSGGELVLTGLVWHRGPADSEAFVAALAGCRVAALAAGNAAFGSVPEDLVQACVRHGLPLFEVPVDVSFATITERVVLAVAAERPDGAVVALDRHRRLVSALADGASLDTVLSLGAAGLGAPCWVLSSSGELIAGSGRPLPADLRAKLAGRYLLADRLPSAVRLDGPGSRLEWSLLPVSGGGGHRLASWFLLVDGDHQGWGQQQREVAAELATLVSLERSRRQDRRRIENRAAGPLLHTVASPAAAPSEVDSRLAAAGFAPADSLGVLVASAVGGGPGLAAAVLEELVAEALPRTLVGAIGDEAVAVVSDQPERILHAVQQVRAAVQALEPGLGDARLTIGISGVTVAGGLHGALQEARHAHTLAEHRPGRARLVASEEIASHLLLLATVPDELRRSFRERLLGPLLAYDAEHSAELVGTLQAFLDCSGSPNRTAAALHVHVNTVRYRLGRIEELTGRELASFANRVDFYLALGCS